MKTTKEPMTVQELFDAYLSRQPHEYRKRNQQGGLTDRTKRLYEDSINRSRNWLALKVDAITDEMVNNKYKQLRRIPAVAEGWRRLMTALFNYAIQRKQIQVNPFHSIPKNKRCQSVPVKPLDAKELKAWWAAAERIDSNASDALKVCLLTGFAKSDVYALRWDQVDLKRRVVSIDKRKLPLSKHVVDIIKRRANAGEYIFGQDKDHPLGSWDEQYEHIAKLAGVDVSPNRLKATFKAVAEGLPVTHWGMAAMTAYVSHPLQKIRADYEMVPDEIVAVATEK